MIEWWNAHDGNLYGAIGGSVLGVVGGCLGAAAGVLAPRGKRRGLVMGAMWVVLVAELIMLAAGLVAVIQGQPYHVWYPLVLCGGIVTLVLGPLIPVVNMRYRQAEARRMDAEGIRRG